MIESCQEKSPILEKHSTPVRRRRILFVLASLGGGGAERVMVTLLRHLDRSRFEPHLALVRAEGPNLNDVPQDVCIHDLKAGRARYCLPAVVRLAWRLRPDAMLSTLGYLNLVLIIGRPLLPPGMKLLVREGTIVSALLAQDVQYPQIWRWLYRCFYKRADTIICQSDYMLNDFVQHFGVPRERLERLYNPVDIERISQLASALESPYSAVGPHLVTAGRLSKEKGYDLLLDAMALVRRTLPHGDLTILGAGPLESQLKAQRDRLGLTEAVHFVGYKSNPYPYLKHADLFVLCSRREGLPNALLEALALGTPVVATDCPGGMGEIHKLSGEGMVICKAHPASLAAAIVSTCACASENGRRKPGGPKWLSQVFEAREVVRSYERLFDTVSCR